MPYFESCSKSNPVTWRHKKTNINIVNKLNLRQVCLGQIVLDFILFQASTLIITQFRGTCRHSRLFDHRVFDKVPPRLCFYLDKMIKEGGQDVCDGYVFLGFTRCSNWLISYTWSVELLDYRLLYSYKLQWWRYKVNDCLKLERTVKLFGDDEIEKLLLIRIWQWPKCSDKILIQGETGQNDSQHKSAYVTITAKPSLEFCQDCSSKNCIKHWFAVHTKYEIAPPFPPLSSDTVIIPGIALFHSGDIFHSLSVCAEKFELIKEPEVEHTSGRPSPRIQSPACSQTEVNSSLCSSCVNQVSKVHEITGDLGCLTSSVRRYVFDNPNSEQTLGPDDLPFDIEDDITMQYHTVLPVDVRIGKMNLKLLNHVPKSKTNVLTVRHLSLDIEHLIGEIIRIDSELSKRFIALITYDVKVLYVQEETMSVFLIIFCLIKGRKPGALCIRQHGEELYSVHVTLEWSLITGNHVIHKRSPLQRYLGNKKSFKGSNIRYIGPPKSENVIMADNEPFLRDESKTCISDHAGTIALRL